jgi:exportin-5
MEPAAPATDDPEMPQLLAALEAIHDPRSSNALRHEATSFLERAKLSPEAFRRGFNLAANPSPTGGGASGTKSAAAAAQDTVVRHFGLSMMLYYLKYVFKPDDEGGGGGGLPPGALPNYVVMLAQGLRDEDPPFVRNKAAQIWTELAKRVWGGGRWLHMDEQLTSVWRTSVAHQMFAYAVLESLSDDIFNHEDHVAGLRADLGSALSRICITEDFFLAHYPQDGRDQLARLRFEGEGWLQRLCDVLKILVDPKSSSAPADDPVAQAAVKNINVLQSLCCWLPLKCMITASTVQRITYALAHGNTQIRLVRRGVVFACLTDHRRLQMRFAPYFRGPTSTTQAWRSSSSRCSRTNACNCCTMRISGRAKPQRTRMKSTRSSKSYQRCVGPSHRSV